MSFQESINAYLVSTDRVKSKKELEELKAAHDLLKSQISEEHIRTIKATEGYPLIAAGVLTKKDVFIFRKFEGDFFQQLQSTKALIVGTRCLIRCLERNVPIPRGKSPVYSCAMRELQICATGISAQEKERLKQLVQWMGGLYFQDFGRSITHLVSNTICSSKYEVATLQGIPVMHTDWAQRVWDRSNVADVVATDEEFQKYRLPIFFNVNVTSTGVDNAKKNEIMRLVNENGGVFHRAFRSNLVDVVITEKNKTNTEKYQAAVRYKKDILLPEWIFDSVEKGFALPTKDYQVKAIKASTPTKTDQSIADFTTTDQSNISNITSISKPIIMNNSCNINETVMQPPSTGAIKKVAKPLPKRKADAEYLQVLDEISVETAKKAGCFLDGCCIYLSGFLLEERDKLIRILNIGGATRYDALNDKITHIIVGVLQNAEVLSWKKSGLLQSSVHLVRLEWLLESIKLQKPAAETNYKVSLAATPASKDAEPDAPSPSSKRTLRSMQHSFKKPETQIKKKLFTDEADKQKQQQQQQQSTGNLCTEPTMTSVVNVQMEEEEEQQAEHILAQYSQENLPAATLPTPPSLALATSTSAPAKTKIKTTPADGSLSAEVAATALKSSVIATDVDYEKLNFFQGATIFLDKQHYPEEYYTQMFSECEAAQGNMVESNFKDPVDYAVVTFEDIVDVKKLPVKARIIVTDLYVEDCIRANELLPIQYYHKPMPRTAKLKPLLGMILVISTYTALERDYLAMLGNLMGATVKNVFVRKDRALLICPLPEGSKYQGALKWKYPVVTHEWLLKCADLGIKMPYNEYLVGASVSDFPTANVTATTSSFPRTTNSHHIEKQLQELEGLGSNLQLHENAADPQPVYDITPVRNKRVSELAGSAIATAVGSSGSKNEQKTAESPHTPVQNLFSPGYDFKFMYKLAEETENPEQRELLIEIIDDMRKNQTPELERIKRRACTPINQRCRSDTPKGIPKFCETPEFRKRMFDELEKRWRLPIIKLKPDTPLHVLRSRMFRSMFRAAGMEVTDDEENENDDDAQPSTSANSREASTLLERAEDIANTSCHAKAINVSDVMVPATQTPPPANNNNDSELTSHLIAAAQRASFGGKSTINFDNITFDDTKFDQTKKRSVGAINISRSPELKQLNDFLKQCHRSSHKPTDEVHDTDEHYLQPFESEQLGVGSQQLVGWADPMQLQQMRRSHQRSMQHSGTPRFSLCCFDEAKRAEIIKKINDLGGEISESIQGYDASCTHFLNERPNRGERTLGCIAAGKWLLSLQYVEECFARDVFIDEEYFEFGNSKAMELPTLSADEKSIAAAAHRWRKDLTERGCVGAFANQRVVVRCSENTIASLKNVLKAGGAEVVEVKFPLTQSQAVAAAITHCYVDMKRAPISQNDLKLLNQYGVKVLQHMFINAFLTQENPVEMEKFLLKVD